jgi:hypothetical protein
MSNARIVYRQDGQVRSFGIASMISRRRVWCAVQAGVMPPPTDACAIEEAASGPGAPAYSPTC